VIVGFQRRLPVAPYPCACLVRRFVSLPPRAPLATITVYIANRIVLGLCLLINVGGQIGFTLVVAAAIQMSAQVFQYWLVQQAAALFASIPFLRSGTGYPAPAGGGECYGQLMMPVDDGRQRARPDRVRRFERSSSPDLTAVRRWFD